MAEASRPFYGRLSQRALETDFNRRKGDTESIRWVGVQYPSDMQLISHIQDLEVTWTEQRTFSFYFARGVQRGLRTGECLTFGFLECYAQGI